MDDITRWLYLSDLNHLVVREWANGLWFAVSFAMCIEFGRTLVQRLWNNKSLWRQDEGTRVIVALFAYFLGETLMRGWVWLLLALQNNGYDAAALAVSDDYIIAFAAATISTWGALCCLYVFSKNHWAWLRAATIVLLFGMFAAVWM